MMNRRQFVYMAGAALFAHVSNARAATYDLLIKGGRVIDPSVGLDAIRDIAIAAGKIVAVEADIAGDASQTIDARGKIVAPRGCRKTWPTPTISKRCGAHKRRPPP